MQLAALHRWHWIVIALVVGLSIGLAQDAFHSGVGGIYVDGALILTDQQAFENGLVQEYNGARLFTNPIVYTHHVSDAHGNRKTVDVVTGSYWNGQFEEENGKQVGHYQDRAFLAQRPYKPVIGAPGPNGGAAQTEYPSVEEFLAALHRSYGVNYRHAWWADHPVLTWLIGSLIIIGGIWPMLINLLTFGSLMRPPEAKGLSLWKVQQPRPAAKPAPPPIMSAPMADEDEKELPQPETAAPQSEEEESPEEAVARALAGGPLELAPEPEKEAHEYSAKPDDFYPTERRARASNSHPH